MFFLEPLDPDRSGVSRLGLLIYTDVLDSTNIIQFLRWRIHAAIASVAEIAIFVAPLWLVWKLQQPKSVKIDIAIPFALRLLWVQYSKD